jgi:Kef-type K+ transport system membrane component KefB
LAFIHWKGIAVAMEYYLVLLPAALLLVASKVLMKLCERINLPSVIGMLLAGVLVGLINYIPGQDILTDASLEGIGYFAQIGVVLIMFSAGLETNLVQIKQIGGPAVVITFAGVIVPMGLGFLVATLFNGGFAAMTSNDVLLTNLFYGTVLAATSVSVSVATLRELGKLNSKVGNTIVAAAILDDIVGIVVLSIVLALKNNGTVVGLALCFLIAYVSERYFGIADITGAYIVGLILSTNPDCRYIDRKTEILGYMIFVPLFFGNIGLSTQFSNLNAGMLLFGGLFIITGMIGKVIGCGGASLLCKYSLKDSFRVGVGMMARAEVALVTAQKGVEYGIIDTSIMPFIVLLIVITSFVTPIALQSSYKKETPNDLRAGQLKQ